MKRKKDSGWRNHYHITNSNTVWCADMRCSKCGNTISGDYLIKDRTNFLHRGNETDEHYIYHRECSPVSTVWLKFDEDAIEYSRALAEREIKRKECLSFISEKGFSLDELIETEATHE